MTKFYGVDVSRYQANYDFDSMDPQPDFIIARASYGTKADPEYHDMQMTADVMGAHFGAYHAYHPQRDVAHQSEAFLNQLEALYGVSHRDLIPAIDVERYPADGGGYVEVDPSWEPKVRELHDRIVYQWGACMIYITQRDWRALGEPAWMLDEPLWVAHWTPRARPKSPGGVKPAMWQYRVGPWSPGQVHVDADAGNADAIDHNMCDELPLLNPALAPLDGPDTIPGPPPERIYEPDLMRPEPLPEPAKVPVDVAEPIEPNLHWLVRFAVWVVRLFGGQP